jgi:hypothetical protein
MVDSQVARDLDYRLRVQAGWTGPAQVSKGRGGSFDELDLQYVELLRTSSAWQLVRHDLGVLRRTVATMLRGEGLTY